MEIKDAALIVAFVAPVTAWAYSDFVVLGLQPTWLMGVGGLVYFSGFYLLDQLLNEKNEAVAGKA